MGEGRCRSGPADQKGKTGECTTGGAAHMAGVCGIPRASFQSVMKRRHIIVAIFLAVVCIQARPRPSPTRARANAATPVTFDAAAINTPSQADLDAKGKGSGVVRAQILLDRAYFSSGEIDGYFGTNLRKALAAYQEERKLTQSGEIDQATWEALNADTAPALIAYTITPEDSAGPFQPIPNKILEMAKLPALGYASPLEGLAEKFHCSPALLRALNPGANFQAAGQALTVPNVITMPPGRAAKIVVSKSEGSVRAYDAEGRLLAFYPATVGSEHDPLPIGNWKVTGTRHNPDFHYNPKFFWDAKSSDEKALLKPGPNNPVGLVWIDLSKEHNGLHGTPEPSRVGHAHSHGCIRLTNWDALELAAMVRPGVPAILKE
jgi:lipoprotein-anchoring transpeptidase ErfK/SrfK